MLLSLTGRVCTRTQLFLVRIPRDVIVRLCGCWCDIVKRTVRRTSPRHATVIRCERSFFSTFAANIRINPLDSEVSRHLTARALVRKDDSPSHAWCKPT